MLSPLLNGHVVGSPAQTAEYADGLGGPVALRGQPRPRVELEEGAVRLWLPDGASAQQAYEEMAARLGAVMGGPEILVGVTQDRLFDRSSGSASAAAPATSWVTAPTGCCSSPTSTANG